MAVISERFAVAGKADVSSPAPAIHLSLHRSLASAYFCSLSGSVSLTIAHPCSLSHLSVNRGRRAGAWVPGFPLSMAFSNISWVPIWPLDMDSMRD